MFSKFHGYRGHPCATVDRCEVFQVSQFPPSPVRSPIAVKFSKFRASLSIDVMFSKFHGYRGHPCATVDRCEVFSVSQLQRSLLRHCRSMQGPPAIDVKFLSFRGHPCVNSPEIARDRQRHQESLLRHNLSTKIGCGGLRRIVRRKCQRSFTPVRHCRSM